MSVRFQVEPDFYDHPKTAGMSDAAFSLWVRAGSYSAAKLTDGFVSESVLVHTLRSDVQVADELVERGLWRRRRGGWIFHEWTAHANLTRERVQAHNKSEADRKKAARQRGTSQVRGQNVRPDVRPDVPRTPAGVQPDSDTVGVGVKDLRGYVSGGSLETYEVDQGKDPPPKIDPGNPRCADHVDVPAGQRGPNCGACADVRKRGEEQRRAGDLDRTLAARRCTWCDTDGWRIDPRNRHRGPLGPPGVRCDHTPLTDDQLERFAS